MAPWLKVRSISTPQLSQAYVSSCDYTTPSQTGSFTLEKASSIVAGTWVPSFVAKADDANGAKLYVGGSGAATFPLAVVGGTGQSVAFSLPQGNVMDFSKVTVDGRGTSGLVVHFLYGVLIPPEH